MTADAVATWTLGPSPTLLATHARSRHKGGWMVERSHWDGLPWAPGATLLPCEAVGPNEVDPLLGRIPKAATPVTRRTSPPTTRWGGWHERARHDPGARRRRAVTLGNLAENLEPL